METKCEGEYEDDKDYGKGDKCVNDVIENDDVLPKKCHLSHIDQDIDPSKCDCHSTYLPDPTRFQIGF